MAQVPRHMLPHPGMVIVLNGASSAGKTSIAKALQAKLDAPYHHVQLDAFRAMEPPGYRDAWEQWAPGVLDIRLAEQMRGDRKIGLAAGQASFVHVGKEYDFQ